MKIAQVASTCLWKIWRRTPRSLQNVIRRYGMTNRVKGSVADLVRDHVDHQTLYTSQYFTEIDKWAATSAGVIAETIAKELRPKCVIDVGCGTGLLLQALKERGVAGTGLEYADAAIARCRSRGVAVEKFNIEEQDPTALSAVDAVVSFEVAEHIPERFAERYVDLLTGLASCVVFTAAPPGQGGDDHVNEQPPEYWIAKFKARRFALDKDITQRWKILWRDKGVTDWYHKNLLVFRREVLD